MLYFSSVCQGQTACFILRALKREFIFWNILCAPLRVPFKISSSFTSSENAERQNHCWDCVFPIVWGSYVRRCKGSTFIRRYRLTVNHGVSLKVFLMRTCGLILNLQMSQRRPHAVCDQQGELPPLALYNEKDSCFVNVRTERHITHRRLNHRSSSGYRTKCRTDEHNTWAHVGLVTRRI